MEDDVILTEGEPYPVMGYLEKHKDIPVNVTLGSVGKAGLGGGLGGIGGGLGQAGGDLPNQRPEQGATKPHECHNFYNSEVTATYAEGASHISYHMTGLYPLDLKINPASGVISGQIVIWNGQPAINCKKPDLMRIDGRNWRNNGRPEARSWTFTFGVYAIYHYTPPPGGGTGNITPGVGSGGLTGEAIAKEGDYKTGITSFSITVIRTNDMDTLIFGLCYMLTEQSVIPVNNKSGTPGEKSLFILDHNLNVYGKRYTLDEFDDWVKAHPGPFPKCENAIEYIKKLMGVKK